ncbi:MAG: COX15/CtaA family protein, partial [Candidatus Competibacteraceae bacterium]|nr:COX15/CtaA family protein [Candidatus Competibacteraceae bacterium]
VLRQRPLPALGQVRRWRPWALAGLVLLVGQIALGGWTSANYAALACPDFPTCQGQWWPAMDFQDGFVLWRGLGISYEGGVLDNEARVAIHMAHRLGAVVVALYLGLLAGHMLRHSPPAPLRGVVLTIVGLLALQLSLGILNVLLHLPLAVAVAHNGVAALLLLSLVALNYMLNPQRAFYEHPDPARQPASTVA